MRPEFHFTADGWINDPHAITYARGKYHHFFQYVPGSTKWDIGCHWGHAVGHDLFSLSEVRPALAPGDGDDGVWSGAMLVPDSGSTRILYTSVNGEDPSIGRIRTATPLDAEWITWAKGPIVSELPADASAAVFRDPALIHDDGRWYMLVGAGLENDVAAALVSSSTDGISWDDAGIAVARSSSERHPVWAGSMWECPQLIEVDGRHVLIVSVWDQDVLYDVVYAVGGFAEGRFLPTAWGRLTYGAPYAATTFRDAAGDPCVMFWLRGVEGDGWAGAHSIAYRLRVAGDRVLADPHSDIASYQTTRTDTAEVSTAWDIEWPEDAGDVVTASRSDAYVVTIRRSDGEATVETGTSHPRATASTVSASSRGP